jgi:protein-S-isoprenylcysteine O-methyltransferase Ste14
MELEDHLATAGLSGPAGATPSRAAGARLRTAIDLGERLFSVVLFGFMAQRLLAPLHLERGHVLAALAGAMVTVLILISEGLVAALMVARRFTREMSLRPRDWLVGLAGVCAPMLVGRGEGPALAPVALCALLVLFGLTFAVWGKVTLWRGFGLVAANRGVVRGGPYQAVRHPIYTGYILTYIGYLLANPGWRNAAVEFSAVALIVVRILAEERVLAADPAYRDFMGEVRYRLAPGVF